MLVLIPAGLFIVAAVLDIVDLFVEAPSISVVTFWNIVIGIAAALLAAVFGLTDWTKIPAGTRAKRVGAVHGLGNVIAVALFAIAAYMRWDNVEYVAGSVALALEVVSFAILGVTAWLGGELVDRLGVGVDEGANVDAPNSLRVKHLPATRP